MLLVAWLRPCGGAVAGLAAWRACAGCGAGAGRRQVSSASLHPVPAWPAAAQPRPPGVPALLLRRRPAAPLPHAAAPRVRASAAGKVPEFLQQLKDGAKPAAAAPAAAAGKAAKPGKAAKKGKAAAAETPEAAAETPEAVAAAVAAAAVRSVLISLGELEPEPSPEEAEADAAAAALAAAAVAGALAAVAAEEAGGGQAREQAEPAATKAAPTDGCAGVQRRCGACHAAPAAIALQRPPAA